MSGSSKIAVYAYTTANVGDEIQSIAASRLLPRVDTYVDRDSLGAAHEGPVLLLANGWHIDDDKPFPPAEMITPIYISTHFTSARVLTLPVVSHLRMHSPIGCRDTFTAELLRRHDVPAYFSGCLTTTLTRKWSGTRKGVFLVDVDTRFIPLLPKDVLESAEILTHALDMRPRAIKVQQGACRLLSAMPAAARRLWKRPLWALTTNLIYPQSLPNHFADKPLLRRLNTDMSYISFSSAQRFQRAEDLLDRYQRARLVVTSRLHCALPCVAMGVPVVFLHPNVRDRRFTAISRYLRVFSLTEIPEVNWEPIPVQTDALKRHRAFLADAVARAVRTGRNPFQGAIPKDAPEEP